MIRTHHTAATILAFGSLLLVMANATASQPKAPITVAAHVPSAILQVDSEIAETGLEGDNLARYASWLQTRRAPTPAMAKNPAPKRVALSTKVNRSRYNVR